MSALSQPATSQRHPLSVAVIGAGMAGRTHANAWRQVGTVFGSEGIPVSYTHLTLPTTPYV